jgi:hypothetical protein
MRGTFVPRLEVALIALMCGGFLLIAQTWSFVAYQIGLTAVLVATLLNIAVGNLPRQAGAGRALLLTAGILAIVAAVFAGGIVLVPWLAALGR